MKDKYPTRHAENGYWIKRECLPCYSPIYSEYNKNGYAVFKDVFDSEMIKSLPTTEVGGLITPEPGIPGVVRSITGVHNYSPFSEVAYSEEITDIVKQILGSKIYIHQSRINFKLPLVGSGWHWHSDFETWHAQDGMPEMRCLTAMIPLTKNTEFNGPLLVIPGSHMMYYSCKKSSAEYDAMSNFADQKEGLPDESAIAYALRGRKKIASIKANPGDLILFDCNILHGSVPNMSPVPRSNLFFVYNSIENKLVDPFNASKPRPEEMGTRNITKIV